MSTRTKLDESTLEPAWEVARLFPAQGTWSVDDYLELSEQHNKLIEFTDGAIEILPMPTTSHQLMVVYLYKLIEEYLVGRGGMVLLAPLRLRLSSGKFREPDLVYLAAEHLDRARNLYWEGADLVMEVVSEGGRERDLDQKPKDYAESGIPEYWIVDPLLEQITVLTLSEGTYLTHGTFGRGELATSALLPGFTADVSAVFDRQLA
jgi:Uma2 family endonuclease